MALNRVWRDVKEFNMALKAGDWVEVKSKAEILRTLDTNGRLENLPFMPQMFEYCGRRLRVFKRAHKTCDTVNPIAGRWLSNTVHLELRCDGMAYGGCDAGCLVFWKEAWLKTLAEAGGAHHNDQQTCDAVCTEEAVWNARWTADPQSKDGKRYYCQATELPQFTQPLRWWDIRQYLQDYTSGNVSISRMAKSIAFKVYNRCLVASRVGRRSPMMTRIYDRFQSVRKGTPFPIRRGTIPAGQDTPVAKLDLQPGEWVRVKSFEEIVATYDTNYKNRGMVFDKEMVPFCGGTYRVLRIVNKLINERTGRLQEVKTPSVILDSVFCQARYSECRLFCPRAIFPFWREIWLERVQPPDVAGGTAGGEGIKPLKIETPAGHQSVVR